MPRRFLSSPRSRRALLTAMAAAAGGAVVTACGAALPAAQATPADTPVPSRTQVPPSTAAAPMPVQVVERVVEKVVEVEKIITRVVTELVVVTVTPPPTPTPALTAVRFATLDTTGARRLVTAQAVHAYESAHPDVLVKVEFAGPDALERLPSEVQARAAAHVVTLEHDQLFPALAFDALTDISDLAARLTDSLNRLTVVPGTITPDGQHWYGLPYQLVQGVWFANLDLFERARLKPPEQPYTREQAVALAKAIHALSEIDWGISIGADPFWQWGPLALASAGEAQFFRPDGTSAFDAPEVVDGLGWVVRLGLELGVAPTAQALARLGLRFSDASDPFTSGRVGFVPATTDDLPRLQALTGNRFAFDVIPAPLAPIGRPPLVPLGARSHAVTRTAAEEMRVEAAVAFAAYLADSATQTLAAQRRAWLPVHADARTRGAYGTPEGPSLHNLSLVLDAFPGATDVGYRAGWSAFAKTLRAELGPVFDGAVSPKDGLARGLRAAEAALRHGARPAPATGVPSAAPSAGPTPPAPAM